MKNVKILFFVMLLPLFWISCSSAPVADEDVTIEAPKEEGVASETSMQDMEDTKESAESLRNASIEAKVPVAMPDKFKAAELLFEQAEAAESEGDYSEAVTLFMQSEEIYRSSLTETEVARKEARAEMDKAKGAIAETEGKAVETQRDSLEMYK